MALNSTLLYNTIKTKLSAYKITMKDINGGTIKQVGAFGLDQLVTDDNKSVIDVLVKTISEEVINHIKAFATVNSVVTVASVTGVTTGPGVSGPGAGSSVGTIG